MINLLTCLFGATIIFILFCSKSYAKDNPLSVPPPGTYIAPNVTNFGEAESFSSDGNILCTYYFYWYDVYSKLHIVNSDGSDALVDHPADIEDFSYKSVSWHKQELKDMIAAGIDVLLPVYWGDTGNMRWSATGIEKLVEAEAELKREGLNPPKIGLFYDTSSLMVEGHLKKGGERPDITTQFGKELFYKMIRDFYSLILSQYWFEIDDKPIVWLYSSAFASKFDKSTIDFARQKFVQDFAGKELYIVGEVSWQKPDISVCYKHAGTVKKTGTGEWKRHTFDIPDAGFNGRQNGNSDFRIANNSDGHETISEVILERDGKSNRISLGSENVGEGISQNDVADGKTEAAFINGKSCRRTVEGAGGKNGYAYFDVSPEASQGDSFAVKITVEYLDEGTDDFSLQYDSGGKGADIGLDNLYAWGAALAGPNFHGVAAIGPGYDDSAVPGRTTPKRKREEGQFYIDSWGEALESGKNIIVLETWNELHEGTDICETKEYGRQYINLTAEFSRKFNSPMSH